MTPERWAEIEELFHRVLECDAGQRDGLLEDVGHRDPDLRRQVEALLLSSHGNAEERPPAAVKEQVDVLGTGGSSDSTLDPSGTWLMRSCILAITTRRRSCCSKRETFRAACWDRDIPTSRPPPTTSPALLPKKLQNEKAFSLLREAITDIEAGTGRTKRDIQNIFCAVRVLEKRRCFSRPAKSALGLW